MALTTNTNIFYQHLLPLQHDSPLIKIPNEQYWASIILFFGFAFIVILKISAYPKLVKVIQSTYNPQIQSQLEREEFSAFRANSILFNLLYLLTFAFLLFKINLFYKLLYVESNSFTQYVIFVTVILVVYSLKFLANKMLMIITDESKSILEFETNCFMVNHATGMFLYPWLVLSQLSKFNPMVFISGAAVVFVVSVLIKWYRGLIIGLIKQRIGILQILLYFCALEILPTLALVKYLIETF